MCTYKIELTLLAGDGYLDYFSHILTIAPLLLFYSLFDDL